MHTKKMFRLFTLIFVPLIVQLPAVSSQGDDNLRGFISISDSNKVKVILNCGPKYMTVQLRVNETWTPEFRDWIVVGTGNKPQCRLQGTGQTEYIVEIPVMNDPCGTKMMQPSTFENVIRIGKIPGIILKGDELVTVRCVYGLIEIGTPNIPDPLPTDATIPQLRTIVPAVQENPKRPGLAVGYVYLIVFLILFLALLFLLCGCLYFFFKRRKLRVERRKKLILAVPPGSELNKLGLGHLWWSGKSSIGNDALLSHDYMVSSNSTREGLSVSTDYAADTPSTSSGSPQNPDGKQVVLPRVQLSKEAAARAAHHSLQSLPEAGTIRRETPGEAVRSQTITVVPHQSTTKPVYAAVDLHQKKSRHGSVDLDSVDGMATSKKSSDMRSISEIYRAGNEGAPQSSHHDDDRDSLSTLEGRSYADPSVERSGTVTADVHAAGIIREHIRETSVDREWTEEFVRAIEHQRGLGPRKLNEQEVARWRNLVENDANVQETLRTARTLEDFESISQHPRYEKLFAPEKWSLITQSLAHSSFMMRLTNIIDQEDPRNHHEMGDLDHPNQKRRYLKKQDASGLPRKLNPEDLEYQAEEREQRIFTRESYYRVKEEVEYSEDETRRDGKEFIAERATSEFSEGAPVVIGAGTTNRTKKGKKPPPPPRQDYSGSRSGSEYQYPPTLNVYVGNVADRQPNRQLYGSAMSSGPSYDNWQASPDEL